MKWSLESPLPVLQLAAPQFRLPPALCHSASDADDLPSLSALGLSSDLLCPLSASPGTPGHFNCSAYSEEGEFTENDEYKVVLHASSLGENYTDLIFMKYTPRLHSE